MTTKMIMIIPHPRNLSFSSVDTEYSFYITLPLTDPTLCLSQISQAIDLMESLNVFIFKSNGGKY